jgi:hypothetical protein
VRGTSHHQQNAGIIGNCQSVSVDVWWEEWIGWTAVRMVLNFAGSELQSFPTERNHFRANSLHQFLPSILNLKNMYKTVRVIISFGVYSCHSMRVPWSAFSRISFENRPISSTFVNFHVGLYLFLASGPKLS